MHLQPGRSFPQDSLGNNGVVIFDLSISLKAGLFGLLKKSGIGKAVVVVKSKNYVIETANPENLSCLTEPLSAFPVLPAWSWVPRRMIMQKQNSGTAVSNCRGKYFPWMYHAGTQTPNGNQNLSDELIFGIEVQGYEVFFPNLMNDNYIDRV
jgi:hypothetical protein